MIAEITIERSDKKFFNLDYKSGVKQVLTIYEKTIVSLNPGYEYSGPDLRDFNTSCAPYEHVFYGVVSTKVHE